MRPIIRIRIRISIKFHKHYIAPGSNQQYGISHFFIYFIVLNRYSPKLAFSRKIMVIVLDGNSDIDAHMKS